MDKTALRRAIAAQKAAMTPDQIAACSQALTQLALASPLYRQARSVYGYLSYNQEVRTRPLLEAALAHGKRVAVPKMYGRQMRFLWLTDLDAVAPGCMGIPEPLADGRRRMIPPPWCWCPAWPLTRPATGWATAAGTMTASWRQSRTIPPLPCATASSACPTWKPRPTTFPWTRCCGCRRTRDEAAVLRPVCRADFRGLLPGGPGVAALKGRVGAIRRGTDASAVPGAGRGINPGGRRAGLHCLAAKVPALRPGGRGICRRGGVCPVRLLHHQHPVWRNRVHLPPGTARQ